MHAPANARAAAFLGWLVAATFLILLTGQTAGFLAKFAPMSPAVELLSDISNTAGLVGGCALAIAVIWSVAHGFALLLTPRPMRQRLVDNARLVEQNRTA